MGTIQETRNDLFRDYACLWLPWLKKRGFEVSQKRDYWSCDDNLPATLDVWQLWRHCQPVVDRHFFSNVHITSLEKPQLKFMGKLLLLTLIKTSVNVLLVNLWSQSYLIKHDVHFINGNNKLKQTKGMYLGKSSLW